MATSKKIGRTETIELNDGTEVVLRPSNIKILKKFMKKFGEIKNLDRESEDFDAQFTDIMVDMSAIALSGELPEATAYIDLNPEKDEEAYEAARELWEVKVDQEVVSFINEVCGGIVFGGGSGEDFQREATE